jgi:nitroreductase
MKRMLLLISLLMTMNMHANDRNIKLPEPDTAGGMPLMQALKERQSNRDFSPELLSLQELSNICWAAWGINRAETGRRTAPSSRNRQEMSVYVVLPDAVYVYNATDHQIDFVLEGDLRAACGSQEFVATAPLNLIYVADMVKMGLNTPDEITGDKLMTPWANCGFMAQNVYLYCASEGLGTVIRAMIDRETLHQKLGLAPMQQIIMGQTIGKRR